MGRKLFLYREPGTYRAWDSGNFDSKQVERKAHLAWIDLDADPKVGTDCFVIGQPQIRPSTKEWWTPLWKADMSDFDLCSHCAPQVRRLLKMNEM